MNTDMSSCKMLSGFQKMAWKFFSDGIKETLGEVRQTRIQKKEQHHLKSLSLHFLAAHSHMVHQLQQ